MMYFIENLRVVCFSFFQQNKNNTSFMFALRSRVFVLVFFFCFIVNTSIRRKVMGGLKYKRKFFRRIHIHSLEAWTRKSR